MIVVVAVVAGAIAFLRWRAGPPLLELVALHTDGRFQARVSIAGERATTPVTPGAVARMPLILAIRNTGGQSARPERLELNVPIRYRLAGPDGRPLEGRITPGNPLVRYEIPLPLPPVEPGRLPLLLPLFDTLWLEPMAPRFHCMALADSVPEFVPAPAAGAEALARLQIFYSFEGEELGRRHTGLLDVELDPAVLGAIEPPEPPPIYPTQVRHPSMPLPAMGGLRYAGHRYTHCGPPEEPLELFITAWETLDGGRFFVVDYGGAPRKYLFDLNNDGVIELEMWDANGDGRFEARRAARLPTPAFLLPPAPPARLDPAILAELPADSLARLDRFRRVLSRPYQPVFEPGDTAPRTGRFRPRAVIRRDPPGARQAGDEPRHVTIWGPAHPLAGSVPPPEPGRPEPRPPASPPDRPRPEPEPGPPAPDPGATPPVLGVPATPAPPEPPPAPAAPVPEPDPTEPRPRPRPDPPDVPLLGRPTDSVPAPRRPPNTPDGP